METKNADLSSLRIDRSKQKSNNTGSKRILLSLLTVLIIILIIFFGYLAWQKIIDKGIEVELTTVSLISSAQSSSVLTASGYVVAQRKASVASKGTGRLIYLGIVEGDSVKKDQIIGRLENSDVIARLQQSKANLQMAEAEMIEAESNFTREKELFDAGVSSERSFVEAESRFKWVLASIELAKAQIRGAEVDVEYTLIRAPFDGTVLTKNADVGEIVSPLGASATSRAAIVTMADMSSLQVEADVSESNIQKVEVNQPCEIELDAYPNKRYSGYLDKIVPTADRAKATVLVKVAFKNYDSSVLPEMGAKVHFLNSESTESANDKMTRLVVPKDAVLKKDSKYFVFKVEDEKAVEKEIKINSESGAYFEVSEGVVRGEKVIADVSDKIQNGTKVKIL